MHIIFMPRKGETITAIYLPRGKEIRCRVLDTCVKKIFLLPLNDVTLPRCYRDYVDFHIHNTHYFNTWESKRPIEVHLHDPDFIFKQRLLWQLRNQAIGLLEQLRILIKRYYH